MVTENLSTLKIHKLTQEQYYRELENGNIDETAFYLTPDEEIDLSPYATIEQLNTKANEEHTHDIDNINNLQQTLDEMREDLKGIFIASYGTTTNREIEDAIADGKAVFCINGAYTAVFLRKNSSATRHVFGYQTSEECGEYLCDGGEWSSKSVHFKPREHASTHAQGGTDEITPAAIGASVEGHTHDDIYYTEFEIDEKVAEINDSVSNVVTGIEDGSIVAKMAEYATFSNSAIFASKSDDAQRAEKDALSNVITSTYETKTDAVAKLEEAKAYADEIKNELLNGAGGVYDTLGELGNLIDENAGTIDALREIASGKADVSHSHAISDITNLQATLDNKADSSHTHVVANISDLTATATELNYVSGVTSGIQAQLNSKAASSHNHSASNINSGTLSSSRLPTVPIDKGGTGATSAAAALTNLGITATAAELNYCDGVTSNIQTQISNIRQIPACTSSDNGKFLCVVNGVATWISMGNGDEVDY